MLENSKENKRSKNAESVTNQTNSGDKLMQKTSSNYDQQSESCEKSNSALADLDNKNNSKIANFNNNNSNNTSNQKNSKFNYPKEVKHSAILPNFKNFRYLEEDGKKVEERKVFQRTEFRPKTISFSNDNTKKVLGIKAIPQTSIEKIVKIMNKVKLRLIANNEEGIVDEVDWAIKEILSDSMYKIEVHEKFSKEEKEFYKEYSNYTSDNLLDRNNTNYEEIQQNEEEISLKAKTPLEAIAPANCIEIRLDQFGPEFDVFDFSDKYGRENLLLSVSHPIFHYKNVNKFIDFSKFPGFVNQIRVGYTASPNAFYHTDYHAADVLQTSFYFCHICKFDEIIHLDALDIFSLLFSALIHDYKHPGFTNGFLIQTASEIATSYNDKSPLENYHLSQAFSLLQSENLNFIQNMKQDVYKVFRKRTIECVLSTDMALHSKIFGQISSKLSYYLGVKPEKTLIDFFTDEKNNGSKFELQQELMNFVLHITDIAHPAKPWEIELKWSDLIYKEFFNQGDNEKTLVLPVSFLCDRDITSVPKSQVGFIKNIILPSFGLIVSIMPLARDMNRLIEENLEKWILMEEEEKEAKNNKDNYDNDSDNICDEKI